MAAGPASQFKVSVFVDTGMRLDVLQISSSSIIFSGIHPEPGGLEHIVIKLRFPHSLFFTAKSEDHLTL